MLSVWFMHVADLHAHYVRGPIHRFWVFHTSVQALIFKYILSTARTKDLWNWFDMVIMRTEFHKGAFLVLCAGCCAFPTLIKIRNTTTLTKIRNTTILVHKDLDSNQFSTTLYVGTSARVLRCILCSCRRTQLENTSHIVDTSTRQNIINIDRYPIHWVVYNFLFCGFSNTGKWN